MASSSVSQDDIDTPDFEKNSRRSRIRTARARQINPRAAEVWAEAEDHDHHHEDGSTNMNPFGDHETSPRPILRSCKDKRTPGKMSSLLSSLPSSSSMASSSSKGKQRRKLREKRRSSGVVHLASTESTGGSTTDGGQDDESVDETFTTEPNKRLGISESMSHHNGLMYPKCLRRRSNSDDDADDVTERVKGLKDGTIGTQTPISRFTPGVRSNTCEEISAESVEEENKRLISMMDEKDRRIHHLEVKIQQLMKDTLTISEDQSRLLRENKTLLRALSNIPAKEKK